jgi:hypothetical protein
MAMIKGMSGRSDVSIHNIMGGVMLDVKSRGQSQT